MTNVETNSSFFRLDPSLVMTATENAGWHPTGQFTQLNSYENRVFDVKLEKGLNPWDNLIVKFYRPNRWNYEAILEEHQFLTDLVKEGVPVVAPAEQKNQSTISEISGMWVSFFPKFFGRMPEEFLENDLFQMGRKLALLHNVGAKKSFQNRPLLGYSPTSGWDNLDLLSQWVAPEVWKRYEEAAIVILEKFEDSFDVSGYLRIHGDCHRGNLLAKLGSGGEKDFFFVDFDDCVMGPEVQDIWMLLAEQDSEQEKELILRGYEEMRIFPANQWSQISLLRGLRIISYSAWIARRWSDPSFPKLFPLFKSFTFWAEETEALEKIAWKC